ncbi:aminotransferase class I/II-fold pyridoxal phosphate-dependent enzyme [Lachnospira sp.]|uniref:MalY/PatB family protein n=1 Tax=Lachnospira sp. TaxID=2049031 RepID=UPI002ECFE04F
MINITKKLWFVWRNLTFVNCTIESLQGFCYIDNLTLKNCKLINTSLAFEFVENVDAQITTKIDSVFNPISGTIKADEIVNRRGTDSIKWDVADNELPMWVADMDFQTAPEIIDALIKRAKEGVFGYTDVNDEWYDAYINWWKNRHGFEMNREWLMFCTGVIPAISSTVRKLTTPNEKVIIQTPVYNIFFNSILNNGCQVLESPLHYEDGIYSIDFDDLEEKMSDPQASLMILCNPHNPVSKIWSKEELAKIGELAKKHGVTIISDEIHCDLTMPGKDYIPFAAHAAIIRKETGLYLSSGTVYGDCGKDFLRMNVACTKANLQDGLSRLKKAIDSL